MIDSKNYVEEMEMIKSIMLVQKLVLSLFAYEYPALC